MKVKRVLFVRNRRLRLVILLAVALSVLSWALYKNPTLIGKQSATSNDSYLPTSNEPTVSETTLENPSSWKEHQSEWPTNVSLNSGEDPHITHFLIFKIASKLPDNWEIGDYSFFYNNDQNTWVQKEGPHTRPGLSPSQFVKIQSITLSENPETYKNQDKSLTRVSSNGLVALVSSGSNTAVEAEIIKSLKIELKSSRCVNSKSLANYDCPAPINVSFVSIR